MNKEEVIKYLKNSIDDKNNYCYSLPIETTKLIIKFIKEQQQEIDRLNNIISELEKWLNEFETKEFNYNFLVIRVKDIQDKLKELKEKE